MTASCAAARALLANADGLAQYFDRDTSEDLANVAMKGFQEFMLQPERLEAILPAIERARARIYGSRRRPGLRSADGDRTARLRAAAGGARSAGGSASCC